MIKKLRNTISVISILVFIMTSCIKNNIVSPISDQIKINIDASTTNVSTSSSFPVKIMVSSVMPQNGISYSVKLITENSNTIITPQISTFTNTNISNDILILNLPQQKWCLATITAQENNNNNDNKAEVSFRVIYK